MTPPCAFFPPLCARAFQNLSRHLPNAVVFFSSCCNECHVIVKRCVLWNRLFSDCPLETDTLGEVDATARLQATKSVAETVAELSEADVSCPPLANEAHKKCKLRMQESSMTRRKSKPESSADSREHAAASLQPQGQSTATLRDVTTYISALQSLHCVERNEQQRVDRMRRAGRPASLDSKREDASGEAMFHILPYCCFNTHNTLLLC